MAPIRFDSRGVTLDGLTGRLGGGDVKFGGRVDKDGYLPGRFDVTMNGRDMRLRFPEGMRSLVDADLTLQGTSESAVVSGLVAVKDAVYAQSFNATASLFDFGGGAVAGAGRPPRRKRCRSVWTSGSMRRPHCRCRTGPCDWLPTPTCSCAAPSSGRCCSAAPRSSGARRSIEGKRFVITRGTVDFNNPARIEPFLDIEAETRIRVPDETYRVTLRVTGPLTGQPNFSFDADPPLGEIEILALIFGDVAPGANAELAAVQRDHAAGASASANAPRAR